jgi:hypothetical protein
MAAISSQFPHELRMPTVENLGRNQQGSDEKQVIPVVPNMISQFIRNTDEQSYV